jgi:ATP-dependent Lon protease
LPRNSSLSKTREDSSRIVQEPIKKEGSSAGITIATGIVSVLKKQPVRNDVAMTGEIMIMGKVLAVGGIQQKVGAAYDVGVRKVLLPADNFKEAQELPSYILDAIKLTPVQTVDEVLRDLPKIN